jgi:glycosyltransferase involved in cell wall biosynthesis
MARGLPVVGVNAYALPELIHHGQNGYLAEPHDHEAMSQYILLALANPKLYASFSQKALDTARQHDVHRSVKQLEKLYQQTINNHRQAKSN